MSELTQGLAAQLAGAPMQQIAQQLGVSPSQAQGAVASALPMLMGALGNNASQPQGAEALHAALQQHAGNDISGVLGSVLGGAMGGSSGSGDDSLGRMLGHIFGGQQAQATQGLGQANGLGNDKTQMLLRMLAPMVMAYLANHMFGGGQSSSQASGPQGLGDMLGREVEQIGQTQGGGLGDLLGAVLGGSGGNAGGLGGLLGGILGGERGS